jgi:16S rRNA (adenine(1408)-N(1))-methyltransferase
VVVDIGTGDGRPVLGRAAREPGALVIGVDASAAAMAEASRRADRARVANAMFVVAGAEGLGVTPLAGSVDIVTVQFPWGSLLRAVLGFDAAVLAGVATVVAPGGQLRVLASVVPSDHVDGMTSLGAHAAPSIAEAWSAAGLDLIDLRPAWPADVAASASTWARRLGERPVWRLCGQRSRAAGGASRCGPSPWEPVAG